VSTNEPLAMTYKQSQLEHGFIRHNRPTGVAGQDGSRDQTGIHQVGFRFADLIFTFYNLIT